MSDDIDRAQNEVERSLAEALCVKRPEGPAATGRCLYCDEILDDQRRWCDAEHREQWQKEARRGR